MACAVPLDLVGFSDLGDSLNAVDPPASNVQNPEVPVGGRTIPAGDEVAPVEITAFCVALGAAPWASGLPP